MKINKTQISHDMGNGSSYKVYVCRSFNTAEMIHHMMMTAVADNANAYWHVSTILSADSRIPEFFHVAGFCFTIVEHNNGDWDIEPTYELYLVEEN